MWVKIEIIILCIHAKSHPCGIHTFTENLLLLLSELDDEENLVKH